MQDAYLTSIRTGKPVGLKGNFGAIASPTVKPALLPSPTGQRIQCGGMLANSFNFRQRSTEGAGSKVRRLSEAELADKRSKNLCFWCNEKYGSSRVCKKKYVHTILVQECSEEGEIGDVNLVDGGEKKEPMISLCATGPMQDSGNQTMRLKGKHKGRSLHILVDSGSTYNVLDFSFVKGLGCLLKQITI